MNYFKTLLKNLKLLEVLFFCLLLVSIMFLSFSHFFLNRYISIPYVDAKVFSATVTSDGDFWVFKWGDNTQNIDKRYFSEDLTDIVMDIVVDNESDKIVIDDNYSLDSKTIFNRGYLVGTVTDSLEVPSQIESILISLDWSLIKLSNVVSITGTILFFFSIISFLYVFVFSKVLQKNLDVLTFPNRKSP